MNHEPAKTPAAPPTGDAIDSKPLIGPEINLRFALSPGMITLLSAPLTVLLTMLLAWLLLTSLSLPLYPREMFAGAVMNTMGGMAASIPLFVRMKRGAIAIAQAGLLGIAVRMGLVLLALLLGSAPAWGLGRMALVGWVLAYYFPMLIAETALVAWLINKARH